MKSPFCGSNLLLFSKKTIQPMFSSLAYPPALAYFPCGYGMRGEAPAATVHCEGRRH